jgi:hypothetical protein
LLLPAGKGISLSQSVVFILGSQRSGTTLLERMLSSHSQIKGGPEPHLLTPLAYSGVWDRVQKAPYDHIIASLGQRAFVDSLPNGQDDYWTACRRFCDTLYGAYMADSPGMLCLDKTPEYATVWPFVTSVYPDAKYIVLTRHPGAIFDSFATSFFDGNHEAAQRHEPILERYVPAIASFLRTSTCPFIHVKYEELVAAPESKLKAICEFLELPFEPQLMDYGESDRGKSIPGLGDMTGISKHSRPTAAYTEKWVNSIAHNDRASKLLHDSIARLDPADLALFGYPLATLWEPLALADKNSQPAKPIRLNVYRMQRKAILMARGAVQKSATLGALVRWVRLACDVILREY